MSYRRQVVQDARRSRPSHSRSEVLSLTRPRRSAVNAPNPDSTGRSPFPGPVHQHRCAVSPLTSLMIAAPCQCRQTLLINSVCGAQRARHDALSYCRSSSRSSSMAAPKTVPSNVPVFVKSLTLLSAANTTGVNVEFNVRAPDAPLKRPVPPVI